jgi:hypothetical protein
MAEDRRFPTIFGENRSYISAVYDIHENFSLWPLLNQNLITNMAENLNF